ncbi:MAG: hypothetical protein ACHQT9_02710 [Candidatus Saccharimonadales bacterium]
MNQSVEAYKEHIQRDFEAIATAAPDDDYASLNWLHSAHVAREQIAQARAEGRPLTDYQEAWAQIDLEGPSRPQ